MSAHDDEMVADYLRRLDAAASVLPFDRRAELIEEITAHIAEARASAPAPVGAESSMPGILDRLGEPADIVKAAAETGSDPSGAPGDWLGGPPGHARGGRGNNDLGTPLAGTPVADTPVAGAPEGGWPPDGGPAWESVPGGGGRPLGALELCAVIFLLIGGLVVPLIGWIAGVILLWQSPRWTRRDKWIGTLIWPGGLLAPVVLLGLGGIATVAVSTVSTCMPLTTSQAMALSGGSGGAVPSRHVNVRDLAASCGSAGGGPNWLLIATALAALVAAIAGPVYTAIRLLRRARYAAASPDAEPGVLLPA